MNDNDFLRDIDAIELSKLPPSYWTKDLDGDMIIVSVLKELPFDKVLCFDEDGERLVCHRSHLGEQC